MKKHWTEQLFVKHSHLFMKVMEMGLQKARAEAEAVHTLLVKHGIKPGSQLLDLNCGIGRHAVELARLGYRVTGVDFAPAYIERAKQLAKEKRVGTKVVFRVVDTRQVAQTLAGATFDAVLNLFTSFGYYDDQTNLKILHGARQLVRRDALFLIDIGNRDQMAQDLVHPHTFIRREDLLILVEHKLLQETARLNSTWTFLREVPKQRYQMEGQVLIDQRIYNLHELIEIFAQAKWRFVGAFGGFDLKPFQLSARRIVAVFEAIGK